MGAWRVEGGGKQKIKTTPVCLKSSFPELVSVFLMLSPTWNTDFMVKVGGMVQSYPDNLDPSTPADVIACGGVTVEPSAPVLCLLRV